MSKTSAKKKNAHKRALPSGTRQISYTITSEPMPDPTQLALPLEAQYKLEYIHRHITESPWAVIPDLVEMTALYPEARIFRNFLAAAYKANDDAEKFEAQVMENYRLDPDYLFARIAYADLCYIQGNLEVIPGIFGGKFDLKLIYPERDTFHTSEILAFGGVISPYLCDIGHLDSARVLLGLMEQIDAEHPATCRVAMKITLAVMEQGV